MSIKCDIKIVISLLYTILSIFFSLPFSSSLMSPHFFFLFLSTLNNTSDVNQKYKNLLIKTVSICDRYLFIFIDNDTRIPLKKMWKRKISKWEQRKRKINQEIVSKLTKWTRHFYKFWDARILCNCKLCKFANCLIKYFFNAHCFFVIALFLSARK